MGLCIIGAKDIRTYMQNKDAILVDLREKKEYEQYHIPGAVSIPAKQLSGFMKHMDHSRILIFYCQHGSLSLQEGKRYARAGYKICSLAGGLDGYQSGEIG